jgi:hypothetical protein
VQPVTTTPLDPAAERALLAAELHDVVTHQATVVAVQLAAAQTRPEAAMVDAPLAAALGVLEQMGQELRRLGRLFHDGRPAPLEPVPSAAALGERLARGGDVVERLPAGVVVCAFRCLELLEGMGEAGAVVGRDALVLDVVFPTPMDDDETAARVRLRLEPCAGRLHTLTATRWRLELPVRA